MHNIWKERQSLKVTEQRLWDQTRIIKMNGWLTELEMNAIKKCMMNETDGVQGYWLKNLPVLHERIATQIGHLKVDDNRENDTLSKRSRQRKCSG